MERNKKFCQTCLSSGRAMQPLAKLKLLLKELNLEIQDTGAVCWECRRVMDNFYRFKRQVSEAQQLLHKQGEMLDLPSLSRLNVGPNHCYDSLMFFPTSWDSLPKDVVIKPEPIDVDEYPEYPTNKDEMAQDFNQPSDRNVAFENNITTVKREPAVWSELPKITLVESISESRNCVTDLTTNEPQPTPAQANIQNIVNSEQNITLSDNSGVLDVDAVQIIVIKEEILDPKEQEAGGENTPNPEGNDESSTLRCKQELDETSRADNVALDRAIWKKSALHICSSKRLTSSDRSRSATPQRQLRSSQRPSTARRALLMGLALQDQRLEPPSSPRIRALPVNWTPGGHLRPTRLPAPPLRSTTNVVQPVLCANAFERVEAMDLSDEDADEILGSAPWHVRRWLQDVSNELEDEECSLPVLPSPSGSTAEVQVGDGLAIASIQAGPGPSNAQSAPNASSANADVRPSTSGVAATSKPVARGEENNGSELDSEFDDEFETNPVEVTEVMSTGRNIPDDEELEEPVREIVTAVERAMDDEADRLLGVSSSFTWVSDFDSFRGEPEQFSGPTPGPVKDYDTPYDAFTDIWSNDIIQRIALETNRYAKQTIDRMKAEGTLKRSSRLHQWDDTNADEIMVLFAVIIYMGIDLRTSQNEYWTTNNVLEMSKFRQLMSYNRYILLCKFLHFVDNCDPGRNRQPNVTELSAKLFVLGPVITHLNSKFSSLYNLQREIAIGESLTLLKGRLSWVQAIRTNATRFGIKSYELCESKTGYLYKFEIYTGKDSGDASNASLPLTADLGGKSTKAVLDLLKDLERLGHLVTMDNFYNSPALARYLKSLGFDCLGTLRPNRKNVPNDIAKVPKNVAKGTIIARHSGDVSVLAWKDSKVVTMISTYHNAETYVGSKAGEVLVKPISVKDYNNTMGGVDLKDQRLSMYLLERKRGVKWYVKMFKRLLNVSIHNALVMHVGSLKRRDKLSVTHREFRYELAKSLVDKHRHMSSEISGTVDELVRLRRDIVHVPSHLAGRDNRKRCLVCFRQDIEKKVRSKCTTCDVFLCFEHCWKEWHSLTTLKGKDKVSRPR